MVLPATSCDYDPCKNGGTCEYFASTNVYHCLCPQTHCGVNCERLDSPCKNGGTCVYCSAIKKIYCECVGSYTGTHCDVPKTVAQASSTGLPFLLGIAFSLLLLIVIVLVLVKFAVGNKRARVSVAEEGTTNEMDDRVKMEDGATKEEKKTEEVKTDEDKTDEDKTEEVKTEEEEMKEEKNDEEKKEEEGVKE